jgi:hypothetical protein
MGGRLYFDFDQDYQWKCSVVVVVYLYICCIVLSHAIVMMKKMA